jgi:hypothetical protein
MRESDRRGKRPRSRSPEKRREPERSSTSSKESSKRSVSLKEKESSSSQSGGFFKKPQDKLSRILQGNAKIPVNPSLLGENDHANTSKNETPLSLEDIIEAKRKRF